MALPQSIIDKAQDVLAEWAAWATDEMKKNLDERLKYPDSLLGQSIAFDGTKATPTGVYVNWELPDYAIYVDLGVKGLNNRSKTYGNFAFRNLHVSSGFIKSLESYITRKGIKVRNDRKESKKTVLDRRKSVAFSMAKAIKKKGIPGTRFYSDVFNDKGFKKLTDALEDALGQDLEVIIIKELQ